MNWCFLSSAATYSVPPAWQILLFPDQVPDLSDQVRNINNHLSDQLSLAQLVSLRYNLSDFNENIPPWPINQWAFWKLRAAIIIFGSVIMAQVMMVIDVDCSQSIRSLKRSILGFPRPSAPYFIVRQNSLLDGNTSDILRNASQVNCPTLQHTASILQSKVLENAKSCLTWDWKSANGGQKAEKCIALSPDMGALFNWSQRLHSWGSFSILSFHQFFTHRAHQPRQHRCQIGAKCKTTMELTKDLMALSALLYWLVSRDRLLNPNCLCKQIRVDKKMIFPWNALTRYV